LYGKGFISVPDLFPGAIYRMLKPAVAMLIFESGSIMILGVRDYSDLLTALDVIWPILEAHKYDKGSEPTPKGSKRKQSDEEKANKEDKSFAREAIANIKYRPLRNKAEFDAAFRAEFIRIKDAARAAAERRAARDRRQRGPSTTTTTIVAEPKKAKVVNEAPQDMPTFM
jgi:hypothetical protein